MVNLNIYLTKYLRSISKFFTVFNNAYLAIFVFMVIISNLRIFKVDFESKLNELQNLKQKSKSDVLSKSSIEEYIRIHESNMEGISVYKPRKLVFNGHTGAGYANKLYSMLSAFTIAILTDSAFICEWNDIEKYIKPTFFLMFHKFRQNNELNSNYESESVYVFNATKSAWSGQKSIRSIYNQTIPLHMINIYGQNVTINRYKYNKIEAYFFELCSNPIYYSKLLKYGLVKKSTIFNALNLVNKLEKEYKNVKELPQIVEFEIEDGLFQIGYEVAGNLLNKYWKPVESIQSLIDHYYFNEFKSNYMIGIQIRTEFLKSNQEVDKFIECAKWIEASLNTTKKVKWYMTSDSEIVIEKAIQFYGNKVIIGRGKIAHVENNKGYERAILDIELLSLCDELILTGGSTFGKLYFVFS
jgi:hypothetical protein